MVINSSQTLSQVIGIWIGVSDCFLDDLGETSVGAQIDSCEGFATVEVENGNG